ncbi:MAG: hypothetical protein WBO89_00165, partial [Propionicimonas sp.]
QPPSPTNVATPITTRTNRRQGGLDRVPLPDGPPPPAACDQDSPVMIAHLARSITHLPTEARWMFDTLAGAEPAMQLPLTSSVSPGGRQRLRTPNSGSR